MPCYFPLRGFQSRAGAPVSFSLSGTLAQVLMLDCGQCHGCRLERSRQWAVRCMHEAQMHERNCFITLTYKDALLSLVPRDLTLFWKDLRNALGPFRYYACGEYGETYGRPHFHACIFGLDFSDRRYFKKGASGARVDTSAVLDGIWKRGFCSVGDVTLESAGYVARYIMKKQLGADVPAKFEILNVESGEIFEREHEFARMSLKPGIGKSWLLKYASDVFPHGTVIVNGRECGTPKFYDKWFKLEDAEAYARMAARRIESADAVFDDNSPRRLRDKGLVAKRKVGLLKREI